MNKRVLHTLEFDKITKLLSEEATSSCGRALCESLEPVTDRNAIEEAQQETSDALGMLLREGSISFGDNRELSREIAALKIGSPLSAAELLGIAKLLNNADRARHYGGELPEENSLKPLFDGIMPMTQIAKEIERCILSENEIADDASPELKSIRRAIIHTGEKIHSQLNKMVNGSLRTCLQDAVITQRDGRYCIPVKAEYKSGVKGMIHDQSSTGSTYFIEPEAIVNLNNELKELRIREKEEIAAILRNLSASLGEHTDEIIENQKILTKLDFIFAKGSLALSMNATRPVYNKKRRILLRKARHPLIDKEKVVPIDVGLGDSFDLLVITGPNTGGKTVTLKTIGLLTLMGQAGLHIPTLDRSELSVFTKVFADIGDEQSIEQSLSTFSSHMKNIVTVLRYADEQSLCLFDELGAGTDPTEGAALAISILDHLHQRGIRTIATTHYAELKIYALETPEVENASCEFDVATLSPTYRLLVGIPGKSNAFAISEKLGLSKKIIESAKARIGTSEKSFEELISSLEAERQKAEKERLELEEYKARIREHEEHLHDKKEKIDNRRDNILRQANAEAKEILEEAKRTADETIRIFQKAGPGASMKELEKEREKLRGAIRGREEKLAMKAETVRNGQQVKAEELKAGDAVRIASMGMDGTVETLPDQKGNLYVRCGALRTRTNVSNLMRIDEETLEKKDKEREKERIHEENFSRKASASKGPAASMIRAELNLIGKTVDEAVPELDKYLDSAYLSHLSTVRIVHGKGTGALRQAIQRHLRQVKYVKEFRLGEYGEGDAGVTIVTFREN
ncbi:MAG: endonuclease MutS2 [Lachnospiraceae bacterium]|nr:endonuclease MutS2 [Lachnospiraceae bacterium]